jgi:hypothetical protein
MKVGTLSELSGRRDGIVRGRRARFGKVSLSLYNHITRSTIISPTCYLWVPALSALIAFTASRPDSKRRPHSHSHPPPASRSRARKDGGGEIDLTSLPLFPVHFTPPNAIIIIISIIPTLGKSPPPPFPASRATLPLWSIPLALHVAFLRVRIKT